MTGSTKASLWKISAAKSMNDIMRRHTLVLKSPYGELLEETAATQKVLYRVAAATSNSIHNNNKNAIKYSKKKSKVRFHFIYLLHTLEDNGT